MMLAVPVAAPVLVTVPVMPPVERVKVSVDSARASSVVAMRSCTELWPAAMVTAPVTVLQVLPPSVETSKVLAAGVSVPTVAVPLLKAGVKLTAVVEVLSRLTVKTASAPSVSVGLLTLRVGVSLSVPPVPVPSSLMVPIPVLSLMVAPLALERVMLKVSLPSNTASLVIATVKVLLVSPAAKFSVPLVAV